MLVLSTAGPPGFIAVFLLGLVAVLGYNTATVLSRVRAYADGSLEVRNRLVTHRLQRSDIDRVMLGRQGGVGSSRRLELLLQKGTTVHLVATETLPFAGYRRLDQQAGELRQWLSSSPEP